MKKSPQKTGLNDLSKSYKKDAPVKLDQAIEKMSNLLGEHMDLRSQTGGLDLPTNSLEDYVSLLNERYNKIVELLSTEEENLMTAQQENSALKAKLADEVKNHQETIQLAKSEIDHLVEKNKEMMARKHSQNMEKQYKEIELKCNEEKIEFIETEIKKNMELEIQERDEIREYERNVKFLEEELDSINTVTKSEENRMNELEEKLENMQKDYDILKKQFTTLKTKSNDLDQKLNVIFTQKNNFSENTEKIIQEQRSTVKKTHSHYQKLGELEKLKKKLTEELNVKTEQLLLIRTKNQDLEAKIKGLQFVDKEIKVQEEINAQLSLEHEVLSKQLEEISNILGKNSSSRILSQSSNRNVLEAKNMKEYENLIKNHPNFNKEPSLEPQKLLDQNSKYKFLVENLEKEINEKIYIIDNQNSKLKDIQNNYEADKKKLNFELEEKNILENKYDELSKKMGILSSHYQNMGNKKINQSFNAEKYEQNPNNVSNVNSSIEKKANINDLSQTSPSKKETDIDKKYGNKSEKIVKLKDYDILNKNPIKLELNEIMKNMKTF